MGKGSRSGSFCWEVVPFSDFVGGSTVVHAMKHYLQWLLCKSFIVPSTTSNANIFYINSLATIT